MGLLGLPVRLLGASLGLLGASWLSWVALGLSWAARGLPGLGGSMELRFPLMFCRGIHGTVLRAHVFSGVRGIVLPDRIFVKGFMELCFPAVFCRCIQEIFFTACAVSGEP